METVELGGGGFMIVFSSCEVKQVQDKFKLKPKQL